MIQTVLKLKTLPKELDATDGIAVAICHIFKIHKKKLVTIMGGKIFKKQS